jgi:hypothetical protein
MEDTLKTPFGFAEKRFPMIPPAGMRVVIQGCVNLREAPDPSIDIIVHCSLTSCSQAATPAVGASPTRPALRCAQKWETASRAATFEQWGVAAAASGA